MLGETIQMSAFVVGEAYSRTDIAITGGVKPPIGSMGGTWSSGIERFDNAALLMVTLEKRHYTYRDYFDGSMFWWQSQTEQTRESPVIRQLVRAEIPAFLFVRVRDKTKAPKPKAEPFVYAGRLSTPDVEGDKPVTALFSVLEFVPDAVGALAEVYGWKPAESPATGQEFTRQTAISTRRATGQGRLADKEVRKAVELHAMALAASHYEIAGWKVRDSSSNNPFDLVCTKGPELRRVEVKGTQTLGEKVEVTIGEVNGARQPDVQTDLFIVHSIAVSKEEGSCKASGGVCRVIEDWQPIDAALSPMVFSYAVPEHK